MKPFLILTVFSLVLLGLSQVNGQCADLIHQYYKCRYQKIVKNNQSDSFVSNNEPTDEFYKNLTSKEMNLDRAMKLFRKIYIETDNCKREFCACANEGVDRYNTYYSKYFRNETVFPHAKNIIEAFIKKFESNLLPFNERDLKNGWEFYEYSKKNLTSLVQFCINNDYSKNRFSYYKNKFTCAPYSLIDTNSDFDCFWEVNSENKKLTFDDSFSNSQMAKAIVCHLRKVSGPLEEKRFCALTLWAIRYPKFIWDKNMTSQIDSFIERARTYKPKVQFALSEINTNAYSKIIKISLTDLVNKTSSKFVYEEKLVELCLDSKALRIDCEWTLSSRGLLWVWANLTFKFDESTSHTIRFRMHGFRMSPFEDSFNENNLFRNYDDRIIKDKFYQNWIQTENKWGADFCIYDFHNNIILVLNTYTKSFSMYIPRNLLDNAKGLVVNGFPELEPEPEIEVRKRKRRSIDELQSNRL